MQRNLIIVALVVVIVCVGSSSGDDSIGSMSQMMGDSVSNYNACIALLLRERFRPVPSIEPG